MKYLRIRNAITILFFAVLLGGCFKEDNIPQDTTNCIAVASGDTLVISPEETVPVFPNCIPSLTVTLNSIQESRCPTGAMCITAGTVAVDLQLGDQFTVNLQKDQVLDTFYLGNRFSIKLIDVTPYPVLNSPTPLPQQKAYIRMIKE